MDIAVFSTLFAELRSSPYVRIETINDNLLEIRRDVGEMIRDEVLTKTGIELPDELVDSLGVSNSAAAYWTYRIDDRMHGAGEFRLQPLREVFLYETDPLWSEETPLEEVEFLDTLRVIDYRPGAGDNKFAAFALESGTMPPAIWYYDRGDLCRMTLDYEGYLEALIVTKGITDWQYLFCEVDREDPLRRDLAQQLRKSVEALAILFPHRDYAEYYGLVDKI
jgi:hypothetical protein